MKRARPKLPDSIVPWPCVVLAVDTARISGWAIGVRGKTRCFGEVDTLDQQALSYIVRYSVHVARRLGLKLVLALEKPWGGDPATIAGLGRAHERWLCAWRQHQQSPSRVARVYPSTWRRRILGGQFVAAKREVVRAEEQRVAALFEGQPVQPDEAPALCILRWAAKAGVIGKLLEPKKRKPKSATDPFGPPHQARLLPAREPVAIAKVISFRRRA